MNKTDHDILLALLKDEVVPASGCTEPGAVALAAAYAAAALGEGPDAVLQVSVNVSPNIYKNGVAVGIPGTGETGLAIAAALGVIKAKPEEQLAVLAHVTPDELSAARKMLDRMLVDVQVEETAAKLYVCVKISTEKNWCEAVIQDKHTHLAGLCRNGVQLVQDEVAVAAHSNNRILMTERMKIADLVSAIEAFPSEELAFMLDGVAMNLAAAEAGLNEGLGMGVGVFLRETTGKGREPEDVVNYAKMLTAAAADARMSGASVMIMSSAGSGNHGITAILPVYAVAKKLGASEGQLARAVALSHLTTIYIKSFTGGLSALCGCSIAAATGAGAAIAWLLGGNAGEIEGTIKNIIANLTGVICDGGKVGCALKLSTAASVAVESALLALRGVVVPDTNGIIGRTVEDTVKNLGVVSDLGMVATDKVILDIMLSKNAACPFC